MAQILDSRGKPVGSAKVELADVATRDAVLGLMTASDLMPHPSLVLKQIGKTIEEFEKTAKQPDVAAASLNFHDGIRAMEWDVSRERIEGDRAKYFKAALSELDIASIVSSACSAREYGYTVLEVIWAKIGGFVQAIDVIERPREWFRIDSLGRLRLITKDNRDGIIVDKVYPRKFILVRHRASYKNPYGEGLLDLVYWLVQGLNANFEWHLQFLEDDGRDHWLAYVLEGSSQKYIDNIRTGLASLRRRSVAVLYEGVRVEQRENTGRKSTSDVFLAFEQAAVTKINKLWLGSDLSMQLGDVGARATTQSGQDIRGEALRSGKLLVEYAFNILIKWVTELNKLPGSDTEQIAFSLYKPADTDKEQAEIDQIYANAAGGKVSEQLLVKRGYDAGDFDLTAQSGQPNQTVATGFSAVSELEPLLNAYEALKKK